MDHSINLTHDGTLIVRIPKGYEVDKVVVEEMGTENRKAFPPLDIVQCKNCKWFGERECLMCFDGYDWAEEEGFCQHGELRGEVNG